jgi:hypothetical protein
VWGRPILRGGGWDCGGLPGLGACRVWLGFGGVGAALDEVDVLAGGGAGKQHAFEGGGAQEASVEVGDDGGEVGGTETGGDGVEVGSGGAGADGVDEMAAVVEQDAGGVQDDREVVGQSGGGVILRGIGRGGGRGVGRDVVHVCYTNCGVEGEARIIFSC